MDLPHCATNTCTGKILSYTLSTKFYGYMISISIARIFGFTHNDLKLLKKISVILIKIEFDPTNPPCTSDTYTVRYSF